MSAPLLIVAIAVCAPGAVNTRYILVVGENGAVAIDVYPAAAVRLFDDDTPQEAKSAAPAGLIVALTTPLAADPVPSGPSTISDPPDVS